MTLQPDTPRAPSMQALVARMQALLWQLGPQSDEGDLTEMLRELEEWEPGRARANHVFDAEEAPRVTRESPPSP